MLKAVLFDIDGVLLDSFESNFLFFEALFRKTGFAPPTREEYKQMFHTPMWDTIKSVTKLDDDKKIEEIWNLARGGKFDTQPPKLSGGVASTVKALNQKYSLAIVTSRVKEYMFEGPLETLKPCFKIAIGYEDTENHKPHPEPLLLAASQLSVPPGECVYIGDVENDLLAARAAGMKCILYTPNKINGADALTSDFEAIPDLVKTL